MSEHKYKWILYLIAGVIAATLAIQGYWTYKNYLAGKQQLMNDVQESLDIAVDKYYTLLAQRSSFAFVSTNNNEDFSFAFSDSIPKVNQLTVKSITDTSKKRKIKSAHYSFETGTNKKQITKITADTLSFNQSSFRFKNTPGNAIVDSILLMSDSLFINRKTMEALTTKVMVSFTQDSLSLNKLDSLFINELKTKNINVDYKLIHTNKENQNNVLDSEKKLTAIAGSVYIPHNSKLMVFYDNITIQVLKKNVFGILLSLILLGSVIASLLYLLKIIRHQKKLAEIKNDLISNITHEFKTPIATIGVATESITSFNSGKTDEKTQRYAQITAEQIKKLNLMVEKLLETASLDSSVLTLNKESVNLNELINSSIRNHNVMEQKTISVVLPEHSINYFADAFHLENALNNVIDNALKYGGDRVTVALKEIPNFIEISISDSGTGLNEEQKQFIFDKFYRVPKGNLHDVKGFGIGLYYTKKIIEKHDGKIWAELHRDHTKFIIRLPYA